MRHVMLDLETYGLTPGSVIRSVGAVQFDPLTGEMGNEFYANVDEKTCLDLGMTKDPGTVQWWERASPEAKASLLVDPMPLWDVNQKFVQFFRTAGGMYLWSQGANFDSVLMEHAFMLTGHKAPWKYNNTRDTRTAYHVANFDSYAVKRAGTYHNALDDARHQVLCVHLSYKKVYGGGGML